MLFRMTSTTVVADDPANRPIAASAKLFAAPHWPLALGAIGLVTLGAFENRAVSTALPTLVAQFHALGAFGLANAAPVASYLVSLAITGLWTDRRGPVPALRAGVVAFALAQLIVGTAVSMPMVVAGRLLSGLAEGLIDVALMVLIARALPEALRPRMFSLFAAMWILPSVLGPALTGLVTETIGWRWVFLGALALLVPAWLALQPAIRLIRTTPVPGRTADTGANETWRQVVPYAVGAAVAVFLLTLAGHDLGSHVYRSAAVVVAAVVVLGLSVVRLMPAGLFRAARGFPAVVLLRAIVAAAFGGVGAFLPLLLTLRHHFGPSRAGISLTITGLMWAFGSWLQGRDHDFRRTTVLRAGLPLMTAGLSVTTLLAWSGLPAWAGLTGWAVAGIGMGLSSPSLSVLTLELAGETNQGRYTSAAQMAASVSMATSFAVSGTLLALAAPDPGRAVFGAIITAGAVIAAAGLLVARRVGAPVRI
jgi:MFS family permease